MAKDEIVRLEIIKKAQILFRQYGLKKTTMDEIATACGKAKSTLYHYFKNKEEVFNSVIDTELMELRKYVKLEVEKENTLVGKMSSYMLAFHKRIEYESNLYRVARFEVLGEQKALEKFKHMMEYETNYIARILEDAFDVGEFKLIDKSDIPWFAEAMVASFFGMMRYSIETNKDFSLDKMKLITNTFIPKLFG
jgi:AcrR family transcriptional regulator